MSKLFPEVDFRVYRCPSQMEMVDTLKIMESYLPNRKIVFQPSFFRGYVKLRGGNDFVHLKFKDGYPQVFKDSILRFAILKIFKMDISFKDGEITKAFVSFR